MQHTLNCRGRLLNLSRPLVMGILNVTPDSFFDGGRHTGVEAALKQAGVMLSEGAALLDVGGASSRPGAKEVSAKEELQRVVPVIEAIVRHFPEAIVSVDTWRAFPGTEVPERGKDLTFTPASTYIEVISGEDAFYYEVGSIEADAFDMFYVSRGNRLAYKRIT